MIEVEIKNFQAIDDLKLAVEGFTALVGRSNIGKSSIVRALKCALSGSSGSDFVRHDARLCPRLLTGAKTCKCFASVRLTFGPGEAILWEKGARGINRYTVWRNGVESVYDRVGQSVDLPDFLESKFAPVKLGPSESLLQVSSQFDAPFLLDLSGPAVASVLSDIGQLDDINQALAAVAKDRRAAVSTRKVREEDIAELDRRLQLYERLDDHLLRVQRLEVRSAGIEQLCARLRLAERLITGVTDAARALRRVASAAEARPPEPTGLLAAAGRLKQACGFIEGVETKLRAARALKASLMPALPKVEAVVVAAQRLERAKTLEARLRTQQQTLGCLQAAAGAAIPTGHEGIREVALGLARVLRLEQHLSALRGVSDMARKVEAVAVPDMPSTGVPLQRLVAASGLLMRLERLEQDITRTQRAADEATAEVAKVRGEFSGLGLCPTCRQGIRPENVAHV